MGKRFYVVGKHGKYAYAFILFIFPVCREWKQKNKTIAVAEIDVGGLQHPIHFLSCPVSSFQKTLQTGGYHHRTLPVNQRIQFFVFIINIIPSACNNFEFIAAAGFLFHQNIIFNYFLKQSSDWLIIGFRQYQR